MCHRRRSPILHSAALGLAVVGAFITVVDARASANDPLSRPEFNKEISLTMSGMDVAAVFRAITIATGVPFILDFTPDPTLTVSIEATNMGVRGILESLSSSYSLEYAEGPTGVLVLRAGAAPSGTPLMLAPPRAASAPLYWFDLYVRESNGRVQRFPRRFRDARRVQSEIFHMADRDTAIPVVNRGVAAVNEVSVGAFELAMGVSNEDRGSLEIVAELIERRSLGPKSYHAQHTVAITRLSASETQLFRTTRGDAIVVAAWGRVPQKPTAPGAP